MGVDVPELDDKGYADILANARKRITVHAEEWTDHNAHDPGITLLETLAWVAEAARYRLDRVTERHVLKYLWLLGVRPDPPVPATVELHVRGTHDSGLPAALDGVTVPAGERVVADDGSGGAVVFETAEPVTLSVAAVGAVESDHDHATGSGTETTDNTEANRADGVHYLAFGPTAERGSSLTLGLTSDPFGRADRLDLSVALYEADLPPVSAHETDEVVFEPSVELAWEYWARGDDGTRRWRPLAVERDETMRFYRGGTVTVARPDGWSPADWRPRRSRRDGGGEGPGERPTGTAAAPAVEDDGAGFVGIRCRVSTPGYEIPPRIDRVEVNVVRAHHRSTRSDAVLHRPDGGIETTASPNQTFRFADSPVLSADVDLVSGRDSDERRERWTEVADFDASGPDDRHYVLEGERGVVRFGDNVRGAVPPAGRRVVAASSVHGGGVDGNVPRTATWAFSPPSGGERADRTPWRELAEVSAVGSATGGRDAETVESAVARLRRELETPYRAVTVEDYRYLATNAPGIRVARASARVLPAAGPDGADVTRVTVMPYSTLPKSVEPTPSAGLLAAVERHLSAHRLVTDRVEVAPPEYVGVGVAVEARIVPGYAIDGRTRAIEAALDEFLDPLTGFDGEGWPFGRPVYKSELYGVVKEVSGVDWVIDVAIRAEGHDGVDEEGNVLVGESAVVRALDHDVSVQFRSETGGVSR